MKGQLRLTSSLSLVASFLIDAVGKFIEKWPQTSIDILTTDDSVNLIESRIDLAIRITNDLEPNVVAKRIGECRSVVCAAPDYIKKKVPRLTFNHWPISIVYHSPIMEKRRGFSTGQTDLNLSQYQAMSARTYLK